MSNKSIVRVRFAPSPTGLLHIGGLRTALYNYLFARRFGGTFVVRIEDTDQTRFVPEAEDYIFDALAWAGIQPDESPRHGGDFGPYRQSERLELYRTVAEQLVRDGHAYVAFDTEEEIDRMRASGADGAPARYGTATRGAMSNSLTLTPEEVSRRISASEPHVIRLLVPEGREVSFTDAVRGPVSFHSDELDDQVLLKSDGYPTYHLANVVDDHEMAISHVIRGEEWLPSTPKHLLIYEALGWEAPDMAHLPLILSPTGGKLSKRSGDKYGIPVFVLDYRDQGFESEAVINYLALLGWHPSSDRERFSLEELTTEFAIDRVGSSGVQFDIDKLRWFNEQVLREMPTARLVEAVAPYVAGAGFEVSHEELIPVVELLHDRLSHARDILQYREFFEDPASYEEKAVKKRWKEDTSDIIRSLADELAALEDWSAPHIEQGFDRYVETSGFGRGRVMPATRIAVSGRASGPDLFPSLALLGRTTVLRRLSAAADVLAVEAS